MLEKVIHILLLFMLLGPVSAKDSASDDNLSQLLLSISDDLYYNYNEAVDEIDSIKRTLSEEEFLKYKPYFCYFNAFEAYKSSEYSLAITYADSSLTYFLWNENPEWEARCILIMAFAAETLTLDTYASSYYETASQLAEDEVVKGLALLGMARSARKLKQDDSNFTAQAIALLESSNILESHLLAIRNYYLFNTDDEMLVPDLVEVEKAYLELGNLMYAATTNKQIAYYYQSKNEFETAKKFVLKAIGQIQNTRDGETVFAASLYLYHSNILLQLDDVDGAQQSIEKSIAVNDSLGIIHANYYAYLRLSNINRHKQDYKSADENSQQAIICQREMNEIKRSSSALLAEVLINRDYIDGELHRTKIYQYIRLGLFVAFSLVFFRALINRFRRQVAAKDVEVNKLQENNTALQKNAIEMLSIVKKLEQESSLKSASKDFEKRIMNDNELSSSLPNDFCNAYQKNISAFSFQHSKLSHAEVRTAVMLAMDIPAKSIVKLQCVEPDTLKTYRKRIRRKLELEQGINLNVHLKTILYDLSKST